ncbi:MAG: protein kinase [Planctomycetes bacterium]|nr:protein kinase [Planctomycetota bacterium]
MTLSESTEREVYGILDDTTSAQVARLRALCEARPEQRDAIRELVGSISEFEPLARAVFDAHDSPAAADGEDTVARRAGPTVAPDGTGEPTAIGPYRILQRLGSGGMGTVYLAVQGGELRRRVAVKVIKRGMDTEAVLQRFDAERQALALMDHPSIAKIFDAGTTTTGQPYFVMEFVDGPSLTRYCEDNRLSLRDRLDLFLQVCYAVQHAHHKGIVHRDLKPANILVTVTDGRPVPKIIDFGLAKAVQGAVAGNSLLTQLGFVLGTLDYMSPEQASGRLDVDSTTDVYALGVILYELLVGARPFERAALLRVGHDAVVRHLQETEPLRPSTRLRTAGRSTAVAERRRTSLRGLLRALRSELDWIVMKAIERDRTRRYLSPSELAADVLRYLQDEVLTVGPPSVWYRARKFARRNRGIAASVLAVVVGLGIGLAVALVQYREKQRSEQDARTVRGVLLSMDELRTRLEVERSAVTAQQRAADTALREAGEQREAAEREQRAADRAREQAELAIRTAEQRQVEAARLESRAAELEAETGRLRTENRELERTVATQRDARESSRQQLAILQRELDELRREQRAVADASALQRLAWWLDQRVPDLRAQVTDLAPMTRPGLAAELRAWLAQADWLTQRDGAGGYTVLAPGGLRDDAELRARLRASLAELAADAERLRASLPAAAAIERERAAAMCDWRQAIERVAAGSSPYGSLRLDEIDGLVPLGADPDSGLDAFWVVASGARPLRDGGRWAIGADTGIVLVLLPGGRILRGAQLPGEGRELNVDPHAEPLEGPPVELRLAPYLLAAHELTVGQWHRLARLAGLAECGLPGAPTEPVRGVSWLDAATVLAVCGLELPTEAQFELAAREGVGGRDARPFPRALAGYAHVLGVEPPAGATAGRPLPVGSLDPDAFGLCDLHGNVAEWCADPCLPLAGAAFRSGDGLLLARGALARIATGRAVRGGSFALPADAARSSARRALAPDRTEDDVGVRAALSLSPSRR